MRLSRSRPWGTVPAILFTSAGLLTAVKAQDNDMPTLPAATDPAAATTGAAAASSTGTDLPFLTSGSAAASSDGAMPTLPTLSSSTSSSIPIPTVIVPPTQNAPYMQKSNLPEGTVFICVGAGLAFIGLMMVAWRLLVTWMVNRSVRKAAMGQYTHDSKTFDKQRRKSGFYSQSPDSTLSLEKLSKAGRHVSSGPLPKNQPPPPSSLFFSPTAGAGMQSMGSRNSSGYLPAGYYSAGNSAAGNGMPMTQIGGAAAAAGKRPPSNAYSHLPPSTPFQDSPDHSPELRPGRFPGAHDSASSLPTSTVTQSTRTPSTYLEDLMSIPPLPPPRNHNRTNSDHSRR